MTPKNDFQRQLLAAEYCDHAAWHYREAARHHSLGDEDEVVRHRALANLHLREAADQAPAIGAAVIPVAAGRPC